MKELFKKYLKRECSPEEIKQVIAYIKEKEHLTEVPTFEEISTILKSYPGLDEVSANRIYDNILQGKNNKTVPVKKMFPYLKYAVAAVFIGLMVTGYHFRNEFLNTTPTETAKIVKAKIEPGKNKAILTLADGSIVTLEDDSQYKNKGINSNGEQLVYDVSNSTAVKKEYNYLTIPRGGEFLIKLSDGTQVWLNSESQLKYPTHFEKGEKRVVELVYGEAYFDVSPSTNHEGARFVVLNQSQEIEVLGTEFNIKAYKGEQNISTTLVEGKVKVSSGNSIQNLKPSQQSNLNVKENKFSRITTVEVYNVVSWKEGVFSFRRKSLSEITKVLSRWYDVDFDFMKASLKNKGFNGVLGKDQDLDEILNSLKKLKAIENYQIIDKTVVLK